MFLKRLHGFKLLPNKENLRIFLEMKLHFTKKKNNKYILFCVFGLLLKIITKYTKIEGYGYSLGGFYLKQIFFNCTLNYTRGHCRFLKSSVEKLVITYKFRLFDDEKETKCANRNFASSNIGILPRIFI